MKPHELLKKLRLRSVQEEGARPLDGKDAAAATFVAVGPGDTAPTNWAPSQQDERPRH
jgi:hypothetical protein